jgi:predicted DsbA family dithiol-disulfide isomerase
MSAPLVIDYYSDILCVWAWIAERRLAELKAQWGDRVDVRFRCVNVFGDTVQKIQTAWGQRGGYEGFAEHVRNAAASYLDTPVHPDLWRVIRPTTSATAHLYLKAAELAHSVESVERLAGCIRHAFFVDGVDVCRIDSLNGIAADAGLSGDALGEALFDGRAMAALLTDYGATEAHGVRGSPSWVMNEGRQILYGNVGYRILHANIAELLRHPEQEASWC